MHYEINENFHKLCLDAQNCRKCPDLTERVAVLSELNGNFRQPKVFFLAEAPGRQGGNRTRKPFSGDKSGANFQLLLDSIGLRREEIFITNSALCNPYTTTGANRKPTKTEIKNCSDFLRKTIEIVNPKIIATLGAVALEALKLIEYHQFTLKLSGAQIHSWNGRILLPLYHPSPQVIASHRRMVEQLADFQVLAGAIKKISAPDGKEQGEVL
ncbi:MAG: uracil-DNA glycosylase [Acidobacteriota bacterium]|nr:uracil-DNA glycosylase [Acidobacteriota bacterium]